jgi:transposase
VQPPIAPSGADGETTIASALAGEPTEATAGSLPQETEPRQETEAPQPSIASEKPAPGVAGAPSSSKRLPATPVARRWTTKRLVQWVKDTFGRVVSRETLRKVLRLARLSWKKAKKLLSRANTQKRQAYIDQLKPLLEEASISDDTLLVYIDEAHIHQDTDLGYGWSVQGEPFWVNSTTPGLSEKVSFYGIYIYSETKVRIWPYPRANGQHTVDVLHRLREEFPKHTIRLVWDGAPYHRSELVQTAALSVNIEIIRLPGYSPDFMPVEHLWDWFRDDITRNHCHTTRDELIARAAQFECRINASPYELADRLWVTDELDPEVEKLRIPR